MFNNEKHYGIDLCDILILLPLTAFALLWFQWTAKKSSSARPLPPGPRGLPLLGYLPFLNPNLHQEFSKLATVYGPIFKFWMGTKLCVVITSPQIAAEVLRDQDTLFANRDVSSSAIAVTYGGHDIGFSPYGPVWKKLRKIFVRELSNNTVLHNLYSLRIEEVRKSVRQIYDRIKTPVDVGSLIFLTAMNSVMSMTIGASLQGDSAVIDADQFKKAAEDIVALLGKPNISDVFPALKWFDIQGIEREMRKLSKVFEAMFDSAIAKRKNIMNNPAAKERIRKDFLQFLLDLHDENEDSGDSLTMTEIKAMLVDTFLGATDTTTSSVEWTITELLKHPEILTKVQEELKEVVGLNNNVEDFHLPKLTYLNAVIKEMFRLHPPGPLLIPRCPSQTAIVGGYTIPKGATIFVNVWAIQRDPSLWENPLKFIPERFLNSDGCQSNYNYSGKNFNYFPFGSGRRMCAGVSIGERMVMLIAATFLHSFDWKLPPGTELDLADKFGLIVKKKVPLVAIPTPRLSDLQLYTS